MYLLSFFISLICVLLAFTIFNSNQDCNNKEYSYYFKDLSKSALRWAYYFGAFERPEEVIERVVIEGEVIEGEVIEGGSYRGRRLLREEVIEGGGYRGRKLLREEFIEVEFIEGGSYWGLLGIGTISPRCSPPEKSAGMYYSDNLHYENRILFILVLWASSYPMSPRRTSPGIWVKIVGKYLDRLP